MRDAARAWLPVRAAWNSISSNSSTPATFTTVPTRPFANRAYTSALPRFAPDPLPAGLTGLPTGTFERVPEPPAQCVPDLVMQEEVDGQRRALQQPRLQVRGHARLARQDRLQP